jgi:hypothetical protein
MFSLAYQFSLLSMRANAAICLYFFYA